jgi:hypothetical protein
MLINFPHIIILFLDILIFLINPTTCNLFKILKHFKSYTSHLLYLPIYTLSLFITKHFVSLYTGDILDSIFSIFIKLCDIFINDKIFKIILLKIKLIANEFI